MSATASWGFDVRYIAWAFRRCADPRMTAAHQVVLLWIAKHANHGCAMASPSMALLAREANLSERWVREIVHDLVSWGVLRVELQQGRNNQYFLIGDGITVAMKRGGNGAKRTPSTPEHSSSLPRNQTTGVDDPTPEHTSGVAGPRNTVPPSPELQGRGLGDDPGTTRHKTPELSSAKLEKRTRTLRARTREAPRGEASSPQPPDGAGDETSPPTSPGNVVPFDQWLDEEAAGDHRVSPPRPRAMPLQQPVQSVHEHTTPSDEQRPHVIHQLVLQATRELSAAHIPAAHPLTPQEQLDHLAARPPAHALPLSAEHLALARQQLAARARANGLTDP